MNDHTKASDVFNEDRIDIIYGQLSDIYLRLCEIYLLMGNKTMGENFSERALSNAKQIVSGENKTQFIY
jgi:hypothetical protein